MRRIIGGALSLFLLSATVMLARGATTSYALLSGAVVVSSVVGFLAILIVPSFACLWLANKIQGGSTSLAEAVWYLVGKSDTNSEE
jgi:hypothetical protein